MHNPINEITTGCSTWGFYVNAIVFTTITYSDVLYRMAHSQFLNNITHMCQWSHVQQRELTELYYSYGQKGIKRGLALQNIIVTLMYGKHVYCIMETWIIFTRQ